MYTIKTEDRICGSESGEYKPKSRSGHKMRISAHMAGIPGAPVIR